MQNRQVSMTVPPQTDARGLAVSNQTVTEEEFLRSMDFELAKVEAFTLQKVGELRAKIEAIERKMESNHSRNPISMEAADKIANDFLRL